MTTKLTATYSNQVTTTISGWGQVDQNVSIVSLESIPDIQRGVIRRSVNDVIGMNPPESIGGNSPQGAGLRGFYIFDSISGLSNIANRSLPLYHEKSSENNG